MTATELCPKCQEPVGGHTVDLLKEHLSELHDHILPFEDTPETNQQIDTWMCGSVAIKAAVQRSAIGTFPVLVFEFTEATGPLPPITLILDDTHMRSVPTLVRSATEAAIKAARKAR